MTTCIIAYRVNRGPAQVILDAEHEDVAEFDNFDEALRYAETNGLFQSGQAFYQIIELDEL